MCKLVSRLASWSLLALLSVVPLAQADTITTSFESDPSGDFTLGTAPLTVNFTNGEAKTLGQPSLYTSGTNAWHVDTNTTASISFDTPARELELFFRHEDAAGPSEVRVIDENDEVIASDAGSTSFNQIMLSRTSGEPLIARVEVENGGNSGYVVVDDFSATIEETQEETPGEPLDDPIAESIPMGVTVELTTIASGLTAPNWATYAPGNDNHLFVVDQAGIIYALNLDSGATSPFLDLSSRLVELGAFGPDSLDERGLLGLAFHPNYPDNGLLYTYSSEPAEGAPDFSTMPEGSSPNHQSVVTEWQVPDPGNPDATVDPNTAREILRIDQPQFNHNSGGLVFDNNSYLLISVGDGGSADDMGVGHGMNGNGRDPSNPLGTLLRIDPLGSNSANGQYGIPTMNPFVGQAGYMDEIFAYGFRNPFRFSVDRQTGDIWVADVGQNDIEEVNRVTAGNNYGWNYKEGSFFFDPNGGDPGFVTDVDTGVPEDLVDPVAEYDHDEGLAVVGGFVYRAGDIPELENRYVFGDFGGFEANSGRLFYLDGDDNILELGLQGQDNLGMGLLGIGRDASGKLYALANTTGTPFGDTGTVLRIDPVTQTPPDDDSGTDQPPAAPPSSGDGDGGGSMNWLVLLALMSLSLTARYGSLKNP